MPSSVGCCPLESDGPPGSTLLCKDCKECSSCALKTIFLHLNRAFSTAQAGNHSLSPQAEATPATLEEAALHGDMIFVEGGGGTDYRSIVYKTFALVQWVVANRQPKFILKTDDDAYVHTANLIDALRAVRPLHAPPSIRLLAPSGHWPRWRCISGRTFLLQPCREYSSLQGYSRYSMPATIRSHDTPAS